MSSAIGIYTALFEWLPLPYIVFDATDPSFPILAENAAHAAIAMVKPKDVIGKPVLEAFPDTSEKFISTGVSELLESLRRVMKTNKPDAMEVLHYDIKNPNGSYAEKYWRVIHYPISDDSGKLVAICQSTQDITDEMTIKKKNSIAETQLQQALSIGSVGIWSWDVSSDVVKLDNNLATIIGLKAADVVNELSLAAFFRTIHADDQARVKQLLDAAISKKQSFSAQYRLRDKGKSVRWVIAKGRVNSDKAALSKVLSGVIVDITEQKLAEQDLTDQIAFTNTLTKSLGEGLYALDTAGKVTFMNAAAEKALGWKQTELLGKSMHAAIHFQDAEGNLVAAADCPLLSVLESGAEVKKSQDAFTRKDGTIFPVSYTSSPIISGSTLIGAILAFSDITEQVEDKNDLIRVAARQSYLAESSRILSSSLDYTKTLNNLCKATVPALAEWCTIDLFDEQGTLQQVAVAHADPKKVVWAKQLRQQQGPPDLTAATGVANVIRTGKAEFYPDISNELLRLSAKDAAEYKLLVSLDMRSVIIAPLSESGTVIGALTLIASSHQKAFTLDDLDMIEDVSARASIAITSARSYTQASEELIQRRKLEAALVTMNAELESRVLERTAELKQANNNLERSNGELQDFAYVASHDLQEPLRKIQAFSNLLVEEYGKKLGDGIDYLNRMQAAALRMSSLIEDLLSFSRVTTKAKPLEKTDLNVVVREVIGDLETRIQETNATVTVEKLPAIYADPLQMRQLFQNLIGNALKFHKLNENPVVEVSALTILEKNDSMGSYQFSVKDNGVGFDERYLDRIFAVFQRLYGRDEYTGTGIGLAICRKIAERHGGSITAKSSFGNGATFIVTLPMEQRKEESNGQE